MKNMGIKTTSFEDDMKCKYTVIRNRIYDNKQSNFATNGIGGKSVQCK